MKITKDNPRGDYQEALKSFMQIEFRKTRSELGYTQSQMAELLKIDVRSYRSLEKGEYSCSALSLALYITYCCPNVTILSDGFKKLFEEIQNSVA